MPTINLPVKQERKLYKRKYKHRNDNEIHKYVYNTDIWRKLRLERLKNFPLCEICHEKGLLKLATLVHHKIEISEGKNMIQMKTIGFDYSNLQSLCRPCHKEVHKK